MNKRFIDNGKSSVYLTKHQKNAIEDLRLMMKEYQYVYRPCICKLNNFERLAEKDFMGIPVCLVICKGCGLISQNPFFAKEFVSAFYEDYFHTLYQSSQSIEDQWDFMIERGEIVLSIVEQQLPHFFADAQSKKILEIGCNFGGILKPFTSSPDCGGGATCIGIDLNPTAISFGRSNGLDLHCMSVNQYIRSNPNVKFDLIILNHVLEHMVDIVKDMNEISQLLNDNGYLYIGVPSLKTGVPLLGNDLLEHIIFDHVWYFTQETLCFAMASCGYSPVTIKDIPGIHICSIFKKENQSISSLEKNAYDDICEFLDNAEKQYMDYRSRLRRIIYKARRIIYRSLCVLRLEDSKLIRWLANKKIRQAHIYERQDSSEVIIKRLDFRP